MTVMASTRCSRAWATTTLSPMTTRTYGSPR